MRFGASGKGFQITFANGWTASVQFGEGNYCGNRWAKARGRHTECDDAEIAAFRKDSGVWHRFDSDDVRGWCGPDEVLAFLNEVAAKGGGDV